MLKKLKYIILSLGLVSSAFAEKIEVPEYPLEQYEQYSEFLTDHGYEKYIIINRESQQLLLINDRQIDLKMKVIVGRRGWSTPIKETSISHIITNPSWTVPKSIIPEQLRKINKNPEKYKKRGYNVTVDDTGRTHIVQYSGGWNVLGKVKFKLKDIGNIYMHDTSAKYLFKKEKRKLSHGCIRLEKPIELMLNISDVEYNASRYPKWHRIDPIPVYIVDWGNKNG